MADILNTLLYSYLSNADQIKKQNDQRIETGRQQYNIAADQAQHAAEVAAHQEAIRRAEAEEAGKNFAIAKAAGKDMGQNPWQPPAEYQEAFDRGQLGGLALSAINQSKNGAAIAEKAREADQANATRISTNAATNAAITSNTKTSVTQRYSAEEAQTVNSLLSEREKTAAALQTASGNIIGRATGGGDQQRAVLLLKQHIQAVEAELQKHNVDITQLPDASDPVSGGVGGVSGAHNPPPQSVGIGTRNANGTWNLP